MTNNMHSVLVSVINSTIYCNQILFQYFLKIIFLKYIIYNLKYNLLPNHKISNK